MRKFLVRGAAIAFISAMGFFGSGGHVNVDGLSTSLDADSASAMRPMPPLRPGECIPAVVDGFIWVCLS